MAALDTFFASLEASLHNPTQRHPVVRMVRETDLDLAMATAEHVTSLLVAHEISDDAHHSSSTAWVVRNLAARNFDYNLLNVASLQRVLVASADNNGEYTCELVRELHSAGCRGAVFAELDVVEILMRHASALCRNKGTLAIHSPAGYPAGCQTHGLVLSLASAGVQFASVLTVDLAQNIIQTHAIRARAWTSSLCRALKKVGVDEVVHSLTAEISLPSDGVHVSITNLAGLLLEECSFPPEATISELDGKMLEIKDRLKAGWSGSFSVTFLDVNDAGIVTVMTSDHLKRYRRLTIRVGFSIAIPA
eukprot:CAMPEP_0172686568 /NCGR_PEP_ID=MMETSP1074-20121228/21031_1 /TAXON_ID=2916 /ORGANISM="Ceratium fusus, Strain PA161109" /LENGTH=305 /DNA_ID=CAMNT_0013505891 /DNA_START=346 /DNA_END=1263 /DNA_ORIENTATION=-